jgi:hypothetical protein
MQLQISPVLLIGLLRIVVVRRVMVMVMVMVM